MEPATAQPAPWGTRGARGSFQQRRGLASRFPVSPPRRPGHASSADGFSGEESWAAPVTVLRKRCSGGSLAGGAAHWAAGVAGEPAPAAGRDSRWVRKGFSCAPETPRRWAGRGLPVAPSGRHLPREVLLRAEHVTRVLGPSVLVTRGAWGENGLHAPPLANGAHCERSAARELGTAHSVSLASRARRPKRDGECSSSCCKKATSERRANARQRTGNRTVHVLKKDGAETHNHFRSYGNNLLM